MKYSDREVERTLPFGWRESENEEGKKKSGNFQQSMGAFDLRKTLGLYLGQKRSALCLLAFRCLIPLNALIERREATEVCGRERESVQVQATFSHNSWTTIGIDARLLGNKTLHINNPPFLACISGLPFFKDLFSLLEYSSLISIRSSCLLRL